MKNSKTKFIARSAMIAALYAALTLLLSPFSYGIVQLRVSEMLTLTPVLMLEGVVGVTLGCLIANLFSPVGVADIVLGTLITLIAAVITRVLRKKIVLAALPPIVLNALFLPLIWLYFAGESGYFVNMCSILISQSIVVGCGIPVMLKLKHTVFLDGQVNKG